MAILGAGLVGIELGLHLASLGKKVSVIEMTDHMNDGGNFLHMSGVRVEIKKRGLDMHFSTQAKQISAKGVTCESEGKEVFIDADSVVFAVGQKPLTEEAVALNYCAPEVYFIGDCVTPKNITEATSTAYLISKNIGRF